MNQIEQSCSSNANGNIHSSFFLVHHILYLLNFALHLFWKEIHHSGKSFSKENLETINTLVYYNWNQFEKLHILYTSDSKTSDENLNCIVPTNPVTNNFFSDTDIILDSPPDSSDKNNLPSAQPVSRITSKFKLGIYCAGSTVQTSSHSQKFIFCSDNSINPTLAAQRLH